MGQPGPEGGWSLCPGPAKRASGILHPPHRPPSRGGRCLRAPGLLKPHSAGRGRGLTSPCSPCQWPCPCGPAAGWLGPRPGLMAQLGIETTQVHHADPHPEGSPVGPEGQTAQPLRGCRRHSAGPLMLTGCPSLCRVASGAGRGGAGTWPGALRPLPALSLLAPRGTGLL